MITKRYYVEEPNYLISGGVNPAYKKVDEEFGERLHCKYGDKVIDNYSIDISGGEAVALDLPEAFVIVMDKGIANRKVIIVADSEERMISTKSGLENLFDGIPKLNLIELKSR